MTATNIPGTAIFTIDYTLLTKIIRNFVNYEYRF